MLSPFGIQILGTTYYGPGQVLASHRTTRDITDVAIGKNGVVYPPAGALELIQDSSAYCAACVIEGVPLVGMGRIFVIGDSDMFANVYLSTYPHNYTLADNIAAWAMKLNNTLRGTVSAESFSADLLGMPMSLSIYTGGGALVGTVTTNLGAGGSYAVDLNLPTNATIVGKLPHWLSVRQVGVMPGEFVDINWQYPYNGDVTNDNAIDLLDLNSVLLEFMSTGTNPSDLDGDNLVGLMDLNLVLLSFGLVGE